MRPKVTETIAAMNVLLTKRQITAVTSRTCYGRSKIEMVRRIFNLGLAVIEQQEAQSRAKSEALEREIENYPGGPMAWARANGFHNAA